MSGSNLNVKITADVVDLQTKFAIAKVEVASLSTELNKLAKASSAGIIDPAATTRLQQVAGDFVAAKASAASLGSALGQATGGMSGMAASAEHAHGSISTATREFRALFDELSSGRTRMTPGTLAIIASRVFGLGPAALAATGGVLGLVGGLAYLAYQALKASNALDTIHISAQFAGNLALSRDAIEQFAKEMSQASNVSGSASREIMAGFAAMHDTTVPEIHELTAVVVDYARASGQDATKAAEELAKSFSAKTGAAEYARTLGGVTQAQINTAETADQSGDATQVFAAKMDLLNSALNRARGSIDSHNSSITASVKNWLGYFGMLQSGESFEQAETDLVQDQNDARARQVSLLKQVSAEIQATPPAPDQTLKTGISVAEGVNPISRQVDEANVKIQKMESALAAATDPANVQLLNAALVKTNEDLQNLQAGPVLEQMREKMAQVAATWDGTQSGMLAKQISVAQAVLGNVTQGSKQELEIKTEIARLEVQERSSAGAQIIANAREQISEIGTSARQGAAQRLEAERGVWSQVLAGEHLTAAQRIEVQRSLNQTIAGLERERAQESQTIAKQDASTDIAVARLQIDAAKSAIDLSAAANQAAVSQKLASLRQLTAQEFALNEQALENELAALKEEPVAYDAVYNQIRELKQKLVNDLAALDRQAAEAAKKMAKEESSDWKNAVGEIEGAESGMVSDLLNKRKSLSQSLLSIGAELVTKEIANDLRAITTRMLLETSAANSQKALEQGGFLYHLVSQNAQSAATVQSQSAQTAAVATGNAARTTSTAAAATASAAAGAAAGSGTVMADAAKAFSGVYASVAQIPYVGWIMAPVAASAAYAAVAAKEGLASLDVGTNYVPRDMLAMIHEGEAVTPKAYNPAAGGGSGGGGDVHNHFHLSGVDGPSIERLVHSTAFQDHLAASVGKYFRQGRRG